jgi:outer membrane protein assembly factor BamB
MHTRDNPSRQRLLALRRYINAMEQGDIESAAAVLHEAGQDPTLEQMILELNTVYQEIDQSVVSEQEAHVVYQQLLAHVVDQERNHPAQHNGPFSQQNHAFLMDEPHARRLSTMKEQETTPMPTLAGTRLPRRPPVRTTRVGRLMQIMAAVVVACALSGTILFVLAYHRAGTTPTGSSAATPHAIVAVTTNNGIVYGLQADNGHQLWKFTAPAVQEGNSTGNKTIVQGQMVYALLGSQVYALSATDGTLLWHRNLFIEDTQQDSYDTFLFDQNTLYVSGMIVGDQPFGSGSVYALHVNDGSIAWHSTGAYSQPLLTVHAGIAYVVTEDQTSNLELHALRGDTGQQLWQYSTDVISAVVDDHTVYIYSGSPLTLDVTKEHKKDQTLIALNVQNGQVRWSVPIVSGYSKSLVIGQDKVFLAQSINSSYQYCAYQTSDGKQAWCTSEQPMSPVSLLTTYTVMNNAFYVLAVTRSDSGDFATRLVGYRESDGQPLGWTQNIADPTSENMTGGNGLVFVSTANHVWAINPAGQQIWVYDNPQHILPSGVGAGSLQALSFGSW